MENEKIIIDSDPGVDDFAAILLAIKSQRFNVMGITTVAGNCSLENATRNALKTVEMAELENVPVYAGMDKALKFESEDASYVHGSNGFGGVEYSEPLQKPKSENAIDFLVNSVNENPGEITIVPIGPLTNIAKAVLKDENFAQNVKRLVIMGGAENTGNVTPTAEFNFYKDPDSVKIVLEAGFKEIIIVGLDVTEKVTLNSKLEKLLASKENDKLAKFWYDITRTGAEFDRKHKGVDGSIINDAVTIGYLLKPDLLDLKDIYAEIAIDGENIGQLLVNNNYKEDGKISNCKIAYDVKSNEFLKMLFKTVLNNYYEEIDEICQ